MSAAAATDDRILVRGLRVWAHVGVLEQERQLGQWFELDLTLLADLSQAARQDDLASSLDYGHLITALQQLARSIVCLTLEQFSERILERTEALYGPVPVQLELRKCAAPVPGFGGLVAVRRQRRWPWAGGLSDG